MKNVRSITLGGIVFALEEDAYQALAAYLSRVEARLAGSADLEEIRGDIEGAIGEKLVARKRSEKQAATLADIEAIEHEMGGPDAYSEGEASDTVPEFDTADRKGSETRRRLYRDTDDAIVAGVASGIAQYFDIDPVIVRVLFVLSIFLNGFGVIAYLVLWLVVPAAHTTTEKYAMRGERVTLRDITERVKKNLEEHDVNAERARGVWARVRRILVLFFDALGAIVRGLGSIVRVAAGLILLFGGALALAALAASATFVLLADRTRFPEDVQVLLDATTAGTAGIVALIAGFILALVTLQFFILAGSSLLARRNHLTSRKVAGLAVLWIVSCAVAATAGALQAQDVVHELERREGTERMSVVQSPFEQIYYKASGDGVDVWGVDAQYEGTTTVSGLAYDMGEAAGAPILMLDESSQKKMPTVEGVPPIEQLLLASFDEDLPSISAQGTAITLEVQGINVHVAPRGGSGASTHVLHVL